ncbi:MULTISPECIES: acyl-[acyl-carrier-protein] thioesterase [Calditerrivibrio]|jgi:acyl-ACP thioesterase|uniref:Acyl-ACP thioesterase n=1 Tax=Calditerrivibrio nitroreducens TaxID=477976 RepID=A0A2J6WRT4_9BACT|nr:MAG: hypothetical protein C0187_00025 [Calditerrivibrio nitroreducens]
MIYEFKYSVNYRDVDQNRFLRSDSLVSLLQEAAILHSEFVGFDADYMLKHNVAWMLNRFALVIHDYPFLRDEITIKTWSRGLKSFKAFRDFEVFNNGKLIANATSYWFFIDTKRKRIAKVPEEVQKMYGYHDMATNISIDDSEPPHLEDFFLDKQQIIRYSDIDSNGHLNNVIYLNMLEDTLKGHGIMKKIKEYYISFKKEITYNLLSINVSIMQADQNRYFFHFNKEEDIYAEGVVNLF